MGVSKDWWDICSASPYVYRCNPQTMKLTFQQKYQECDNKCSCHDMNPKPKPLNWAQGQVPKGGGWSKREIDSDETKANVQVEARQEQPVVIPHPWVQPWPWSHDDGAAWSPGYEMVCFTNDEQSKDLTKSCDMGPWIYYCETDGNMSSIQARDDCNKQCRCVAMDPRPSPINWVVGQMPHPPGLRRRTTIEANTAAGISIEAEAVEEAFSNPDQGSESALGLSTVGLQACDPAGQTFSKLERRHYWTVICNPNDQPSKAWTDLCRKEPWSYVCDAGGKMSYAKKFEKCDELCECKNVNPVPNFPLGKPAWWPNKPGQPSKLNSDLESPQEADISSASASLGKRDSVWGLVCKYQESGDQPMKEDEKMTRLCIDPPYGYNCDKRGQRTRSGKQSGTCDDQCFCRNMNPKPRVLGWVYDQVPASGSWKKFFRRIFGTGEGSVSDTTATNETSLPDAEAHIDNDDKAATTYDGQQEQTSPRSEPTSDRVGLVRRHEYAVVCELDGQRDSKITEACRSSPRVYSCDANGRLSKRKYDYYCDQHCACQDMNPKPLRVDVPMGSIPNPCKFCKRGADQREDRELFQGSTQLPAVVMADLDAKSLSGKKGLLDEVWILDCSYRDGTQDLALVRKCHLERSVSCSADGQLQSKQSSIDGRCAAMCFCYQRPV
jgi:hypothetical protein